MIAKNRSRATSVLVNYFTILPSPSNKVTLKEHYWMYSSWFKLPIFFFFFWIKLVISECNSVYCLNGGSCRDEPSGYKCDCRFGFYGKRCEGEFHVFCLAFFCCFFLFTQNRSGKGKNYTIQIETIMVLAFNGFPVRRFQSTIRSILK